MKSINKIKFEEIILHEDDNYIIIDKPAYLSTLEDRKDSVNVNLLAKKYNPDCIINHRLDKETSGALVIAKNEEAYRHFSILLEHHKVNKIYQALVWGTHQFEEMLIEAPLHITGSGKVRLDPRGKHSATIVRTTEKFRTNTLVECKILTGKKHQIRIHLANVEAPIVNDDTYGGKPLFLSDVKRKYKGKDFEEEKPLSRRVCLHSKKVSFESLDGKEVTVVAPLPKDIEIILKQLRKFA